VAEFIRSTTNDRAWLESVEVKEHGGNSAIYEAFSGGIAPGI
jgi:6-pyruvoyltetrahydropterin/6-carboxytetrahydropterin synthase